MKRSNEFSSNIADNTKSRVDVRIVILLAILCVPSIAERFKPMDLYSQEHSEDRYVLDSYSGEITKLSSSNNGETVKHHYVSPELGVFHFQKVPVNRASLELLLTVSGIGPTLGHDIIRMRDELGPFKNIESLKKLPRVGEKRAQALATQLSFN